MILTVMKVIMFLYPFLRELIIGKYSQNEKYRNFKIFFIIVSISSIVANIYLVKSSYILSKEKVEAKEYIQKLEKDLKDKEQNFNTCTKQLLERQPICSVVENDKPKQPNKKNIYNTTPYYRKDDYEDKLHKKLRDIDTIR